MAITQSKAKPEVWDAGLAPAVPPWAPAPAPATRYRPGLDGLRALAIVGVLLYHAGVGWLPGGLLGVDLFFVVSGFLITSLLIGELRDTGRLAVGAFYRRRALRLLPALAAVLLVTGGCLAVFSPAELVHFRGDLVASVGYITNWWFIVRHQSYFVASGRPSPFQHLWSLAVEEQFYLLWPLGLLFLWRRLGAGRRLVRIGVVAAAGACASSVLMAILAVRDNLPYGADSSRVYLGTDTHASGLLIGVAAGALLAAGAGVLWERRPARRLARASDVAGVTAVLIMVWAMLRTTEFSPGLFRGGFLAFSVLAGVAVVAASRPRSRLEGALGRRPLRWIGTRSYGLYLWHWPVFVFTRPQLDLALTGAADLILRLAIVVVLAETSYRLVEKPIRAVGVRVWFGALVLRGSDALAWVREAGARLPKRVAAAHRERPARVAVAPEQVGPFPAGQRFVIALALGSMAILIGFGAYRPAPQTKARLQASRQAPADAATSTVAGNAAPVEVPAQDATAPPTDTAVAPPAPAAPPRTYTVIGDSVMLGAIDELKQALPGANVDAVEGRQAATAFALLNSLLDSGHVGTDVVLHIGTNGTIDPAALNTLLGRLSDRRVVMLTDHVPRPWQDLNNRVITDGARSYPAIRLVDWHLAASAHPEWLWQDGIHLRPDGAAAYRSLIIGALR